MAGYPSGSRNFLYPVKRYFSDTGGESSRPSHLVRVDVQERALRIESGAAPLRAAVIARKDDGVPIRAERDELPFAAELSKRLQRALPGLRRAAREHVLRETLAGERSGSSREKLRRRRHLALHRARGERMLFDRKQGRPRRAIEKEHVALLAGLRDGIDPLSVAGNGDEARGGGEIAVPEVVPHGLEMPDPVSSGGVEGEERVREEVVAEAIGSVEIRGRGSRRHVDDPPRLVHGHARPVVGAAAVRPGVPGPRLVARLARMRDRVEGPAELARARVVGADVSRRGRQSLPHPPPSAETGLVHDARGREPD